MRAENVIHFIYPVTHLTRPFSLVNVLAVKMAAKVQKPENIMFWTNAPPETITHWDEIKGLVTLCATPIPTSFRGTPIHWPQYASDVMRLEILYDHGGIYMDTDIILLKPLDEYLTNRLVFSWEAKTKESISNALMITPANNKFIGAWLDRMPVALGSQTWAQGGVGLPAEMVREKIWDDCYTVLPNTFCCPLDLSRHWLFDPALIEEAGRLSRNSHAIHVFETFWREPLSEVNESYLREKDCFLSRLYRKLEA